MTDRNAPESPRPSSWALARSLSLRDWLDLAEASVALVWAHAALRVSSPARVIARATAARRARAIVAPGRLARVAWLVGVAGRHVVSVPCLSRSVALTWVLARRGAAADVCIGVRTVGGRLEAHAWVEVGGRVVNDDEATISQYTPFERPLAELGVVRPSFR